LELLHAVVLSLIQGFTEYLPISSSGHLILVPALLGWPDQGLAFDIAVHIGTLAALLVYFRRDLVELAAGLLDPTRSGALLAWSVLLATIPLGLAGLLLGDAAEAWLRSPKLIATTTAAFGLALWAADRYGRGQQRAETIAFRQAMLIGLAQALALLPGTSRSGITMTAGLALGLSREGAARFSFLLAIPAIGMAGVWQAWQFARAPEVIDWQPLLVGVLVSAVTAWLTISLFLRVIARIGMAVFAIYRLLLAALILYLSA
jgi:undecaprenyl-diphosphatase